MHYFNIAQPYSPVEKYVVENLEEALKYTLVLLN